MRSANMNIRIDPDVKKSAEAIFQALGITTSDGINIFLKRVIAEGGIPFDVKVKKPNAETLAAFEEVKRMRGNPSAGKSYTDVDDMMRELLD